MNYRHIYHAGNRCDVVKHLALTLVLAYLCVKEAGFCVLDTHAGCGRYDLEDARAAKTAEAREGILSLLKASAMQGQEPQRSEELKDYLDVLQRLNPGWNPADPEATGFRLYPGSPCLTASLLRPQDRLVACELHEEDAAELKRNMRGFPQAQIHARDGYQALRAFLPPPEKRGMVLIDPPYEDAEELEKLPGILAEAWKRWPQGIYMLWYPVKERPAIWRFHEALRGHGLASSFDEAGKSQGESKLLCAEFVYHEEIRSDRLNGSGLIVLNPPWQLADSLRKLFPLLHKALGTDHAGGSVSFL
ncbi:MAG: 23S rRNA (adenine(2030)-N(6))-methyltransferase RlmJ [Bdellovibrionales bacterium]